MRSTHILLGAGCAALVIAGGAFLLAARDKAPTSVPVGMSSQSEERSLREDFLHTARVRLADQPVVQGMSETQRTAIVRQFGEFLDARLNGSYEEYRSLMERWGGEMRFSTPDTVDKVQQSGHSPGDPAFIVYYDIANLEAAILNDGRQGAARRIDTPSGGVTGTRTAFTFPDSPEDLASSHTEVLSLAMPIILTDGRRYDAAFVFLWSERMQRWLPWEIRQTGGNGGRPPQLM